MPSSPRVRHRFWRRFLRAPLPPHAVYRHRHHYHHHGTVMFTTTIMTILLLLPIIIPIIIISFFSFPSSSPFPLVSSSPPSPSRPPPPSHSHPHHHLLLLSLLLLLLLLIVFLRHQCHSCMASGCASVMLALLTSPSLLALLSSGWARDHLGAEEQSSLFEWLGAAACAAQLGGGDPKGADGAGLHLLAAVAAAAAEPTNHCSR